MAKQQATKLERRQNCGCGGALVLERRQNPDGAAADPAWQNGLFTGIAATAGVISLIQLAKWYRDRRAAVTV